MALYKVNSTSATAHYFKSEDVKVFPCSFRGVKSTNNKQIYDPAARLQTEEGYTNPAFIGKKSYVIEFKNNTLKAVIGGYTFTISNINKADFIYGENKAKSLFIKVANYASTAVTTKRLAPIEGSVEALDIVGDGNTDIFVGLFVAEADSFNALDTDTKNLFSAANHYELTPFIAKNSELIINPAAIT